MIFYMEKKDEILEKQPGLGMVSLNFRFFFHKSDTYVFVIRFISIIFFLRFISL